jgi:Family of unknown function (DUF5999)
MCTHHPACPSAEAPDRDAAHVLASHPEQGWSLLCNGVVLFEDCGEILPDGRCIGARRPRVQYVQHGRLPRGSTRVVPSSRGRRRRTDT